MMLLSRLLVLHYHSIHFLSAKRQALEVKGKWWVVESFGCRAAVVQLHDIYWRFESIPLFLLEHVVSFQRWSSVSKESSMSMYSLPWWGLKIDIWQVLDEHA